METEKKRAARGTPLTVTLTAGADCFYTSILSAGNISLLACGLARRYSR